ncbi:MAG: hypothetical protein US31_C0001G0013 [Berkelbacteria bacterium GW2011_GWA1_36_9]|uniref:YcfA family protein n=1 Tax=Berkelbacteria bacterium GW2011_GWA1_36_9 TaxID=1618331 RepID=A0A0G0IS37_9BACT|nr:MAG: hypothetical protein US31_C0001G0013 [Berkelbacteria bacterium GW2011_GWA1_36_9]
MSKKLLPHKNKEIVAKLKKNGFLLKMGAKNCKHFFCWKKDKNGQEWSALVSKNPSALMPNGTLGNIIRTSGKPKEEFCRRKI